MANAFIPIFCCIFAITTTYLCTEIDTESSDLLDVGNDTRETNIENTNCTETSDKTDSIKKKARKPSINKSTPRIPKKRTTPGPDATHLPYTLVFYGERKRRRMYPQISGYVIYRRKPFHREYLVFEVGEKPYHWTPPKGDVEPGETHLERALKELEEDSGLTSDDIIDVPIEKSSFRHGLDKERKQVVFFVARFNNTEKRVRLNSKYIRFKWLPASDSKAVCDNTGARMVTKADDYLEKEGF